MEQFDKVKAVEANFDAHDLNISDENKNDIWNQVDVCLKLAGIGFCQPFAFCAKFIDTMFQKKSFSSFRSYLMSSHR